jgi:hypothetical protein
MAKRSFTTTNKNFQSFWTALFLASTSGAVGTEIVLALDGRAGYSSTRRCDAVWCPHNPTAIS